MNVVKAVQNRARLLIATAAIVATFDAAPAVAASGQVTDIIVENYIVFFKLQGSAVGTPACNTSGYFAVDTRTDMGRNTYALLLSARAAGWSLVANEGANCTVQSGNADLHDIRLVS